MPKNTFEARLAVLSDRESGSISRTSPHPQAMPHSDPRNNRDRFRSAVALANERGLGLHTVAPPLFRGLVALGLPVRPLHYLSAKTLFLIGFSLGFALFGGLYGSGLSGTAHRGPLAGLEKGGWPGVIVTALFIGIGLAYAIRRQAKKHGLPNWADI